MNAEPSVHVEMPNSRLMASLRHASRHPAVARVVGGIASAVVDRGFAIDHGATMDGLAEGPKRAPGAAEALTRLGESVQLSLVRCAEEFVRCLLAYGLVVVRMPPRGLVPVIVDPAMQNVDVYRFVDPEFGYRYYAAVYVEDNMYTRRAPGMIRASIVAPLSELRRAADACDREWRVYTMRDWEPGTGIPGTRLVAVLPILSAHTVISNAHCAAWQAAAAPPLALVADGRYGGNTTLRPDADIFTLADTAAAFNAIQSNAQRDQREEAATALAPGGFGTQDTPIYDMAEEFGRRKYVTFGDWNVSSMPAGTELKAPVVPSVPGGFIQIEETAYDRVARILQMPEEKVRAVGGGSQAVTTSSSTINEGARAERRLTTGEYARMICDIYAQEVSRATGSRVVAGATAAIGVDEARQLYAEGILTAAALQRVVAARTGLHPDDIQKQPLPTELQVQKEIAAAADETRVEVAEKQGETAVKTARIGSAAKAASAAKRPKK